MRVVEEEYGRETLRFLIYWRGPHTSGGSPPGLRLDIARDDVVAFERVRRTVNHGFSDAGELGPVELNCYALEEVMAEKMRAVLGQRNLLHLLPPGAERDFEEVWEEVVTQVTRVMDGLGRGRGQ